MIEAAPDQHNEDRQRPHHGATASLDEFAGSVAERVQLGLDGLAPTVAAEIGPERLRPRPVRRFLRGDRGPAVVRNGVNGLREELHDFCWDCGCNLVSPVRGGRSLFAVTKPCIHMNTDRNSIPDYVFSALRSASHFGLLLVLVAGLAMVGCDSGGEGGEKSSATISGQATDNQSSGGSSSTNATTQAAQQTGVEGAVVTASSVNASGSTGSLEGQATTNADGNFTLEATGEGVNGVVRLNASTDGEYSSGTVVFVDGRSEVRSQPMTAETNAEAKVYADAKAEDEASSHVEGVTAADVAAYVDGTAAADINGGGTASSEVASAIAASVEAETQSNASSDDGASASAVADAKANAYTQLQSSLANAEANAVANFENTMATLYAEAGASEKSQAESRQTSTSIMIEFSASASSDAKLGLRKQAELLRAEATARAQEAIFKAEGASDATLSALADARTNLKANIRTATSVDAIVSAKSDYEATVKTKMEGTFDVSGSTISSAESSISTSVSTLFDALSGLLGNLSGAADAAVSAYSTFYSDAQANAKASFSSSIDKDARAEAAATALVYLSAFSE